jgi:hypothetical protein
MCPKICSKVYLSKDKPHPISLETHGTTTTMAVLLSNYKPTTYNYYEPLVQFAHYHEPHMEMARDKAKVAVEMRQRMLNLRSGEVAQQASTMASSSGRGGGRIGGVMGRGGGSSHNQTTKQIDLNKEKKQLAVIYFWYMD